jgi:hypothetical protein
MINVLRTKFLNTKILYTAYRKVRVLKRLGKESIWENNDRLQRVHELMSCLAMIELNLLKT